MLSTRDPPQNRGHIQTESEGLEKDIHANRDQKKAGVAIFISDKIDLEMKALKRDKEGYYIMIKRSIQEGDIKRFTDKQKLKEFSTTKPALRQMLKDLHHTGNTEMV